MTAWSSSFHSTSYPPETLLLLLTTTTSASSSRCCHIVFHAGTPAERQLFRTDFRFAPSPRRASLAGPPIHEDMVVHGLCGRVPDSAEKSICQIVSVHWIAAAQTDANLSAHLHRLPTPPLYLRQMRLSPGRDAGVGLQMMRLLGRDAVVGCRIWLQLGRCGVPANHRARFQNANT